MGQQVRRLVSGLTVALAAALVLMGGGVAAAGFNQVAVASVNGTGA